MSDRAETEKSFNLLQEEYHQESLPQVIETNLNPEQLLLRPSLGMANVAEECLKKFEGNFLDGKLIGSTAVPELIMYHK